MARIAFERVSKVFPDGTVALSELELEVRDGEFLVLVGPSGCGKTTALRLVAGLEEVTEGRIFIGETRVEELDPWERNVAMVFQSYALYPHMTVGGNIAYPLKVAKLPKSERERRVGDVASLLGISHLLARKPAQLSGGQRQRVALGRAMVRRPRAFLMDEPLSNLDAQVRVEMRTELRRLHQEVETTTLFVTHDQVEAMTLGDRVALLRDGVLQQVGRPMDLYEQPVNIFTATFIGSPAMNLFQARIERRSGETWLVSRGLEVALDREDLPETAIIAGIRPEQIGYSPNGKGVALSAQVDLIEPLGAELQLALQVPVEGISKLPPNIPRRSVGDYGAQFIAKAGTDLRPQLGSALQIRFAPGHIHLFEASSGERL